MASASAAEALASVREYYGEVLQASTDLKTSACCAAETPPLHVREALAKVHPEVLERFYGCGSPLPPALEGATVLDLGCGTGRDVYVLSALVGERGRVIGIDMTPEQLDVARRHQAYHAEVFGHATSNVEFHEGFIEDLSAVADGSVDVIVSNCVINLSPDKPRVMAEAMRVLKPGGELYVSDVFADRRVPEAVAVHPIVRGECLGGALYWEDLRRVLADLGVPDVRVCETSPLEVKDAEIAALTGPIVFESRTIRAFKVLLEDRCEDYGQVATYRGTMAEHPHGFTLDDHHHLETGRPMLVCGNTAAMLSETRYAPHFDVVGDRSTHFGLFDCGPVAAAAGPGAPGGAACC